MVSVRPIVVDSWNEAQAWIDAWPSPTGPWERVSETRSSRDGGQTVTVTLRSPDGDTITRQFRLQSLPKPAAGGPEPTEALEVLMEKAAAFAAENPPSHPGAIPRFPVPSERYRDMVEVPMTILATDDDNRAGLYAPARVVLIRLEDQEPYGVGDFPGFDPDAWPPPRLGDWPPPGVTAIGRHRLAALVGRFNALWMRLVSAAVEHRSYDGREVDIDDACRTLAVLDLPAMDAIYARLSPAFWEEITASRHPSPPGGTLT